MVELIGFAGFVNNNPVGFRRLVRVYDRACTCYGSVVPAPPYFFIDIRQLFSYSRFIPAFFVCLAVSVCLSTR